MKKAPKYLRVIISIILAILTGVLVSYIDAPLKLLMYGIIVICCCFIIAKNLRRKENHYKGTLFVINSVIIIVTSSISLQIRAHNRLNDAEELILMIDQYHANFNKYPASIEALNYTDNNINYYLDTSENIYYISYSVDGWHVNEYDSQSTQWHSHD